MYVNTISKLPVQAKAKVVRLKPSSWSCHRK